MIILGCVKSCLLTPPFTRPLNFWNYSVNMQLPLCFSTIILYRTLQQITRVSTVNQNKPGVFKWQKLIVSKFWDLEVWNQGINGLLFPLKTLILLSLAKFLWLLKTLNIHWLQLQQLASAPVRLGGYQVWCVFFQTHLCFIKNTNNRIRIFF